MQAVGDGMPGETMRRFISAPRRETDHSETRHRRAVTRPRSGGRQAPEDPRRMPTNQDAKRGGVQATDALRQDLPFERGTGTGTTGPMEGIVDRCGCDPGNPG